MKQLVRLDGLSASGQGKLNQELNHLRERHLRLFCRAGASQSGDPQMVSFGFASKTNQHGNTNRIAVGNAGMRVLLKVKSNMCFSHHVHDLFALYL